MSSLNDIVNVQIALQTLGVKGGDFGTPMIVAPHASFIERVRTYTDYTAAVEDGLPSQLLTALSDCFSQTPRPRQVKVGRRAINGMTIVPNVLTANAVYAFAVGDTIYEYTSDSTPTAVEITAGLAADVAATSGANISATASGGVLTITYTGAPDIIELGSRLSTQTFTVPTGITAVTDDLTAILDADPNWYGLVMVERVKQTQLDAAAWTEANEKLFITATSEAAVLNPADTTDLISALKDSRYFRTAVLYHTNAATEYPDAAWAGRVFTIQPGAETWALKSLASVTPSVLTTSQKLTIQNKGGNTFEFYQADIALTNPGKTAAGEWIDVIRFRDWLKDTIQVNMAQMMINRDKIPYTDAGIQLCASNLRKSLQQGQNVGGIAPDELDAQGKTVPGFIIDAPFASDVPDSVKASRVLTLSFQARIAGAIHVVNVNGSLAYSL